ncbi:hypothetical protein [Jannaschia formosa]|uniref:hypothetical protein n=1 Tax=Jannaschia formosa TaxID=2259592 RepID=UPI000E1B693A|nr:hypothetical protein [Jannaschia formosa]TFL19215.1 hypothetical protein DR046_04610 [Jannaschia formosa]
MTTDLRAILLAALCLAAPAAAQPCAEPGFDAALAALEAQGWTRAEALTPAQADALAWTRAITYIEGDDGGRTPAEILELQRKAGAGLLRRVDTDSTRSAVLTRGDEAMTLTQTVTAPGRIERQCRLATAAPVPGTDPIDTTGWPGAPLLADLTFIFPEETE